ncbi:MAG TPA: nucleoside triphosphate pyrophosphohydrolase [Xanthobacteraceae bacterium]|nr:nucleoside triphosphate pyrophosphohydrolase [Xanthobacteraceae bacterium]
MTRPSRDIADLIAIMAALRDPQRGCPWDVAQTFETIAPYTIEEACEVADAIARGDLEDLREELGDLLLQVVFHARMAEERGVFDFGAVVEAITAKLVRRHPHVFGAAGALSADEVKSLWDRIKAAEKAERNERRGPQARASDGALGGIPAGLPALARALALQRKAGKVGFDWRSTGPVLAKIREEAGEIARAVDAGDKAAMREEIGDLLFAVVNLARHCDVDAEMALRETNAKFERRFASIEAALAQTGKRPEEATLEEMDALWEAAKAAERSG